MKRDSSISVIGVSFPIRLSQLLKLLSVKDVIIRGGENIVSRMLLLKFLTKIGARLLCR